MGVVQKDVVNQQPAARWEGSGATADQVPAGWDVPIVEDVREQDDVSARRHGVEEHVARDEFQSIGDAERFGHLAGHLQDLGTVPHDGGELRMALEPGNAVDPRPAADVEQASGVFQWIIRRQHRGDVARATGEREREPSGRRLALHR